MTANHEHGGINKKRGGFNTSLYIYVYIYKISDLEIKVHLLGFANNTSFKNARATFLLKSEGVDNIFRLGSKRFFSGCLVVAGRPWPILL